MKEAKTYFVFDKETNFILSGFDHLVDKEDGYNLYTRPYKYPVGEEKCRMDYIYASSKRSGLLSLKYENLKIGVVRWSSDITQEFVKNPRYFCNKGDVSGWWKICDFSTITVLS